MVRRSVSEAACQCFMTCRSTQAKDNNGKCRQHAALVRPRCKNQWLYVRNYSLPAKVVAMRSAKASRSSRSSPSACSLSPFSCPIMPAKASNESKSSSVAEDASAETKGAKSSSNSDGVVCDSRGSLEGRFGKGCEGFESLSFGHT